MKAIIRGKTHGHRAYTTRAGRSRAVSQLRKRGYNHFVFYRDVVPGHDFALQFGIAAWVAPGQVYIDR